ncbi:MAG: SPASM domain-containing protein, partial [Myxococcota bacterium]
GAAAAGLYPHLVTAGLHIDPGRTQALARAGLRSVQLSIQDSKAAESDRIAGGESFKTKLDFARSVRALGLPLVLNVVLHRHNLSRVAELIALARELDAERLELANTQYHGWAFVNRAALLPSRSQLEAAAAVVKAARRESRRPEILFVLPDYWSDRPKPCMGGWARKTLVVTPDGTVQPCHAAATIPGLEFWKVGERPLAACWEEAPGMNAFRGEDWMREPCRSCPERERDFGGCRCQAFALTGDARATDPACALAPDRRALLAARREPEVALRYRGQRLPRDHDPSAQP